MTKEDQLRIVNEIIEQGKKRIIEQLESARKHGAETWDGHELRMLVADTFANVASRCVIKRNARSKRAKDYRNIMRIIP